MTLDASANPRIAFFDDIASRWDGWIDLPTLLPRLHEGFDRFGVAADERIMDLGCGTGNLTRAVLQRLSPQGSVTAVDISPAMLEQARAKIDDRRVRWLMADVASLPLETGCMDRVLCYSAWPHFPDLAAAAQELFRVLRPGGFLHIWHLDSRETINAIHQGAGPAVAHDLLPSAKETADLLSGNGFHILRIRDDNDQYEVSAQRP